MGLSRKRSVCPRPATPPLPPAAVGAILLAEGCASLAAAWHLEWMPRGRLRRIWKRALISPPSWLDGLGPDEAIKTIYSVGDAHGGRPDLGAAPEAGCARRRLARL